MQFNHPLMHDNFTKADMNVAIRLFRKKNKILTQSMYVKQFEKKWSKWKSKREDFHQFGKTWA